MQAKRPMFHAATHESHINCGYNRVGKPVMRFSSWRKEGLQMKRSLLTRLAILLLIASTLSGCLWVVEEDEFGRRDGGDRGRHRGEHHDRR